MGCATVRVQVHLLDPIPAIVVARVLDGLRALGIDAVLSGGQSPERAHASGPSGRRVCLTTRRDTPSDRRIESDEVVTLPSAPGASHFDAGVASAVLEQVVARLDRSSRPLSRTG